MPRVSLQPSLRHRHRVTLLYCLAFIAIGMSGGLLGPALPHLAEMTGSTMGQIAILFTARALGNMFGSLLSGLLVDRYSGHRVLAVMVVLLVLGLATAPISPTLAILTAVIFLLGFAEVSINAGANALLLWTHGTASPPWISTLHFCFGLGNMLAPLVLVAALALSGRALWAFWLVACYALLLLWPLLRTQSPAPLTGRGDAERASPTTDPWRLALFLALFSGYVGTEVTFAGWITAYAILEGMAAADAALLVTLFWMTLSMGRLLAIPLLRRFPPWTMLRLCLCLGAFTTLGLQFGWLSLHAVALLFGLACSAVFPTLFGLANQLMLMDGRTTGLIFLAAGGGAMAVPSLTGPLLEWFGPDAFPPLLLVLLAAMTIGLETLRHRENRRQRPASRG